METFKFYKCRADLAFELAGRAENADLRDKYLQLAKEWGHRADAANGTDATGIGPEPDPVPTSPRPDERP